jgi:hypothetical protein
MSQRGKQWACEESKDWFTTDEAVQTCSSVLDRYKRVASPTRLFKFKTGLDYALNSLTMGGCVALYPDFPVDWNGPAECVSFADAIARLNLGNPEAQSSPVKETKPCYRDRDAP